MTTVLSLDLGTTFFKATLTDDTGQMLAVARRPTPIQRPRPDQRQIHAEDMYDTIANLVHELNRQAPRQLQSVAAISFATQTNSFVLLDENDRPLTPIILWNDERGSECDQQLQSFWQEVGSYHETGIPAITIHCVPSKILYLQRHQPEVFKRARKLRLIGDQLVAWFTGKHVTEAGAAALTGLLDIHQLQWRVQALDALNIRHLELPTPQRAGTDLGPIRAEIAEQLNLPAQCRLILGCLDQYAGAIGAANVSPHGISETTGTVLATVRLADAFNGELQQRGVWQGPAWETGLYWQMLFNGISANLLNELQQAEPDKPSYRTLDYEAEHAVGDEQLPQLDLEASGAAGKPIFTELRDSHTRGDRTRAVLIGVANALKQHVHALSPEQAPAQIASVGGAAQSDIWLQIKADTLGIPVAAMQCPEPTSMGAAALALARTQGTPLPEVAAKLIRCRRVYTPAGR